MIRLCTLGSLELLDQEGREVQAVLAQPKRLALLVYLAAAQPLGAHRRDRLLTLFWPELDEERGRNALNQAMRFLRVALGADTFAKRASDDIAIERSQLWCDAAAMQEAIDASCLSDALVLYRGPFLPGFFVEGGSGFEDWMERERAALSEKASHAARRLSEEHEAAHRLTRAIEWGRRALDLTRDDERALRRLLTLYDRAGDRAGALNVYEQFAARLAAEYESEPSEETRALLARIRSSSPLPRQTKGPVIADGEVASLVAPRAESQPALSAEPFDRRYSIVRQIGSGGMATVYLARDLKHDRDVAVKVVHREIAIGMARDRFAQEIRIAGNLQHPNIVPLFDSGEEDGRLFYVMPHVQGESLRDRLLLVRQLSIGDAVHLLREITSALAYAHGKGIVHRDIKPDNILIIGPRAVLLDFGIARAAQDAHPPSRSIERTLEQVDIGLGTPIYMAPEQATGSPHIDHRADLYALGVVAYEMLAGRPPFRGLTAESILAAHIAELPQPISELRSDIPRAFAALVMQCLEKAPQSRPVSADEIAGALTAVDVDAVSSESRQVQAAPTPHPARRIFLAAGLATAALAAAFGWRVFADDSTANGNGATRRLRADTTRLVVLPVEHEGQLAAGSLEDDLLHEALSQWRGLTVVDQFQVAEAVRRTGGVHSHEDAAALASSLGAGRYVRVRSTPAGDSTRIYAALFDLATGQPLQQASITAPANLGQSVAAFGRLTQSLVLRTSGTDTLVTFAGGSSHLPAVQAFVRAQAALGDWNLVAADSAFQRAVGFDATYARAALWLAQVRAWQERSVSEWSSLADRALGASAVLSERERQLASALTLLSDGKYEAACGVYDRLRARNDRDFGAWFGLGQCRTMDHVVVRDPASPSGWRLRSSYHSAVNAYQKAFSILPSVHTGFEHDAFERLRTLLLVTTDLFPAYGVGRDTGLFLARPSWRNDSLALVPYPASALVSGSSATIPPGFTEALARQRAEFRRTAAGWSAAFPQDPRPKQAVALALDMLGDPTAVDTLRLARRLAADSVSKVRLAAHEVLLRVKWAIPNDLEQLRVASAIADTLLALGAITAEQARSLAPIATISGRCGKGRALVREAESQERALGVPPHLYLTAELLLVQTALGCPRTSSLRVADLAAAVDRAAPRVPPLVELALLYRQTLLAEQLDSLVVNRLAAAHDNQLLAAARAFTRRDKTAVQTTLRSFASQWQPALGPPTPDIVFPGARLLLGVGDTVSAVEWLDRTLQEVRTYDPKILLDHARAAVLVRAMILRADLAAAAHDTVNARRWGAAVDILWLRADPELREHAQRMSRYARLPAPRTSPS